MDYQHEMFLLGQWQVDPQHNYLSKAAATKKIEKRLMRVLIALANNALKCVTKEQILREVWHGKVVSDETISVAISKLRKSLGCNAKKPIYIETITGVGFRLIVTPQPYMPSEIEVHDNLNKAVKLTNAEHQTSTIPKYRWGYLFIVTTLVLLAVYHTVNSSTESIPQNKNLALNNEVYLKAQFLLQQGPESIHQAEVLLTTLNQQQANNPLILNALGKAKYFQYRYIDTDKGKQLINQAVALFEQAIALDPELADAYLQLALINMMLMRNFTLAEEYFLQAIALDPKQVTSHLEYATMLLSQRRFKEAIHHNKTAQSINPQHYSSASIEWVYNMAEQYDLAEKELAKLFTIDPESAIYNISALRLFESQGDEQRAFHYYKKAFLIIDYTQDEMAQVNAAFTKGGLKELNYWLANIKKEQRDIGQYLPPVSTARYHIGAGEYDKAIHLLELAHAQQSITTLWFNSDPKYKPLRALPRFKELIKKIDKTIL